VYSQIKEVERPVIDTIIQKTNGNTMFALGLMYQLIIVTFI